MVSETNVARKRHIALKRKHAEVSARMERIHRQVKKLMIQRAFPCVPAPELSTTDVLDLDKKYKQSVQEILMKQCKKTLSLMESNKFAFVFNAKVDTTKYPTYRAKIAEPMDFGTIRKHLEDGKYASVEEFKMDMFLVFSNARTFNPAGSDVYVMAESLQGEFCKQIRDGLVRATATVEANRQRDLEAKKAELHQKMVSNFRANSEADILAYVKELDQLMHVCFEMQSTAAVFSTLQMPGMEDLEKVVADIEKLPVRHQHIIDEHMHQVFPDVPTPPSAIALCSQSGLMTLQLMHVVATCRAHVDNVLSSSVPNLPYSHKPDGVPCATVLQSDHAAHSTMAAADLPMCSNCPTTPLTAQRISTDDTKAGIGTQASSAGDNVPLTRVVPSPNPGSRNDAPSTPASQPNVPLCTGSAGSIRAAVTAELAEQNGGPKPQIPATPAAKPRPSQADLPDIVTPHSLATVSPSVTRYAHAAETSNWAGLHLDFERTSELKTAKGRQTAGSKPLLLKDMMKEAGVLWPRVPVGAGSLQVHADISTIRQRIARSFVSTRAVSDSVGVVVLVKNVPEAPVPLSLSVNKQILKQFQNVQQLQQQAVLPAAHADALASNTVSAQATMFAIQCLTIPDADSPPIPTHASSLSTQSALKPAGKQQTGGPITTLFGLDAPYADMPANQSWTKPSPHRWRTPRSAGTRSEGVWQHVGPQTLPPLPATPKRPYTPDAPKSPIPMMTPVPADGTLASWKSQPTLSPLATDAPRTPQSELVLPLMLLPVTTTPIDPTLSLLASTSVLPGNPSSAAASNAAQPVITPQPRVPVASPTSAATVLPHGEERQAHVSETPAVEATATPVEDAPMDTD